MSSWEEGNPSSPLLILGEAPGRVEARLGRPLVGPAGDVFIDCMRTAGLVRSDCYIINTWPVVVYKDKSQNIWHHNGNVKLWDSKKGMTKEGLELAQPTLEKIRASSCNCILSLGRAALDLCTGERRPIMKWRGSSIWGSQVNKKVLPTVHPAATLYGAYLWRYLIITDMEKVKLERDSPDLHLPKRTHLIRPSLADVSHYIHSCREAGRFNTDLEIVNHQVSCFSLATSPQEAMTVPLVGPGGAPYWDEDDELLIWQWYASLMEDDSIAKCNMNLVGFDSIFLLGRNIHTRGPLEDCMIAQSIVYPELPMGLDFIASFHTREPYWKEDGKIWKKIDWDWDVFQRYCGTDSMVSLEAFDILKKEMEEGGFLETYNMTVEMASQLAFMSIDGLAVDKTGLADTNAALEVSISEKEKALWELCGRELNVNSSKQCQEYFYEHLGLGPYKNPMGGITCDDKAMSRIVRRANVGSKEARMVQEIRHLKKLKNTYMEVELDEDSRLRCSWNPRGTWTGRLSSSKTIFGTGMNLQNLDPEFKGFVVAG